MSVQITSADNTHIIDFSFVSQPNTSLYEMGVREVHKQHAPVGRSFSRLV